jgi:hypothetical protein
VAIAGEIDGLAVDREQVLAVVNREIGVGKGVWESRQLIDLPDEGASPMEAELLRDRANRSLEHLFTLLSLILPRQPLRLAFQGLHTGDAYLRGTALEYLETVLPDQIWVQLRPLLEPKPSEARTGRTPEQVLKQLLDSQQSIALALKRQR